ncbi:PRC-barrel domain-containing protein [Halomonas sp. McH1-25]|uniref:PRC-barrel domain-containing protein n=1 Tax=unclassified Halomonas TaxID=2609666 RepID=UPI001EF415F7|nr:MULTISPECIES: PRC-barrel domain-containing protein [unclassified Halomonas]MCG7601590.1 PRC-barrel domain-containing protein [Halomonas sp. McH1-25]MCP1343139.1 PRC-barrel domain-containing protein [Halomonas sp. FL8]MCP1360950.1 PRC-barrel domain-containing protein [Halomonas sp. BBD45]MCP1366965.1 PRC-barrel domain-containing protein [Halomonas sp. BBD48]
MKHLHRLIPLCAAALPFAAMAAPEDLSDWQNQRGDPSASWAITQLLGDDVIAGENTEVGEVADVILDAQGNIQSLLVYSNGNAVERGFYTTEWPVKLFEPSDVLLSIDQQPEEFADQQHSTSPQQFFNEDQYSASSILGMGVQVEESAYAEVEDLVVNDQGQVTSAIIDPDGMDTDNYWVPTDLGWVNPAWILVVPYSQSDIEQSGAYQGNIGNGSASGNNGGSGNSGGSSGSS